MVKGKKKKRRRLTRGGSFDRTGTIGHIPSADRRCLSALQPRGPPAPDHPQHWSLCPAANTKITRWIL